MRSKIAAKILSEKTKLNLESLFHKGYFNYIVNTNLTVETLYSEKFAGKKEGRVVFKLPINIVKDVNSLRMAMDIVVEIAKRMDKTTKHEFINKKNKIDFEEIFEKLDRFLN